jgi:hypothetical protein
MRSTFRCRGPRSLSPAPENEKNHGEPSLPITWRDAQFHLGLYEAQGIPGNVGDRILPRPAASCDPRDTSSRRPSTHSDERRADREWSPPVRCDPTMSQM